MSTSSPSCGPHYHVNDAVRAVAERCARARAPREACGLLLGVRRGATTAVLEAVECRNLLAQLDAFDLHPADWVATEREAVARGLEVLGLWHSHLGAAAELSERDRRGAPAGWLQAVCSLDRAGVGRWALWDERGERVL